MLDHLIDLRDKEKLRPSTLNQAAVVALRMFETVFQRLAFQAFLGLARLFSVRAAFVASAALSKPRYATNFLPITAAETPRKFIPAPAIAVVIWPPKAAASSPSTFNVARFLAGARPCDCAAFRTAAPFAGVRKTTPALDFAQSRHPMTQSRLAPASPSAARTFARPPDLSSILELQMSTFVTVKLIRNALL